MTMPQQTNLYGVGVGTSNNSVAVPHFDTRAPSTSDVRDFPQGKRWINTSSNVEYSLTSFSASGGNVTANWTVLGTNAGTLDTLTASSGGSITPLAGDISLLGTAAQITTVGTPNTITFSLPSVVTAPGSLATTTTLEAGTSLAVGTSATVGTTLGVTGAATLAALTQVGTANINVTGAGITTIGTGGTGATRIGNATGNTAVTGSLTATTTLTATLGAITATNGNLVLGTAGNKIMSTSVGAAEAAGANSFGTVTLVNGTATVATTAITTNSIVFLTRQTIGATGAAALGMISRGTIVNGTSFVINALSSADATALAVTDVSNVGWMVIN